MTHLTITLLKRSLPVPDHREAASRCDEDVQVERLLDLLWTNGPDCGPDGNSLRYLVRGLTAVRGQSSDNYQVDGEET